MSIYTSFCLHKVPKLMFFFPLVSPIWEWNFVCLYQPQLWRTYIINVYHMFLFVINENNAYCYENFHATLMHRLMIESSTLNTLTLGAGNFFLNFSTPVFKMWIIQEPYKVALWNKRHFEERKTEIMQHV
jgi:hypothetical protein